MAELTPVAPGELIESGSFGNPVIDRVVSRYISVPDRDASVPLPVAGDTGYIQDIQALQIYNGAAWINGLLSTDGVVPMDNDAELSFLGVGGITERTSLRKTGSDELVLTTYLGGVGVNRMAVSATTLNLRDPAGVRRVDVDATEVVINGGGIRFPYDGLIRQYIGAPPVDERWMLFGGDGTDPTAGRRVAIQRSTSFGQLNWIGIDGSGVETALMTMTGDAGLLLGENTSGGGPPASSRYSAAVGNGSATPRNILVGTGLPDDSWGQDGDMFFRYDPSA